MVLSATKRDPIAQLGGELPDLCHLSVEKDAKVGLLPLDAELLIGGKCL